MNWQSPTTYPERAHQRYDESLNVLLALTSGRRCVGCYDYHLGEWIDEHGARVEVAAWCRIDPLPDALANDQPVYVPTSLVWRDGVSQLTAPFYDGMFRIEADVHGRGYYWLSHQPFLQYQCWVSLSCHLATIDDAKRCAATFAEAWRSPLATLGDDTHWNDPSIVPVLQCEYLVLLQLNERKEVAAASLFGEMWEFADRFNLPIRNPIICGWLPLFDWRHTAEREAFCYAATRGRNERTT